MERSEWIVEMLMFDRRKNYLTLLSPAIYLDDSEDDRDRELPPELSRPQGSLLPGAQSNMTLIGLHQPSNKLTMKKPSQMDSLL